MIWKIWMIYDLIWTVCICWRILMIMVTMLGMNNLQSHAIHDWSNVRQMTFSLEDYYHKQITNNLFQYISNKMQRYTVYLYTFVCAPDDGRWYHPKHVEQFPDKINRVTLLLVGYILEYYYMHEPVNIKYKWSLHDVILNILYSYIVLSVKDKSIIHKNKY
jgi:hypothetical protein